jgi:hypothetical protein
MSGILNLATGEETRMNWNAIAGLLAGAAAFALIALLAARLASYRTKTGGREPRHSSFDMARYTPMLRLLSDEDLHYLASRPGYRPEIGRKLKRERRRIFRMYLKELACDFCAIHAQAREMVAHAREEHAALVGSLMWQQITFWRAMTAIELRLLVPMLGNVDVRGLLDLVEASRAGLARAPVAA